MWNGSRSVTCNNDYWSDHQREQEINKSLNEYLE